MNEESVPVPPEFQEPAAVQEPVPAPALNQEPAPAAAPNQEPNPVLDHQPVAPLNPVQQPVTAPATSLQPSPCGAYDAWQWAQSVFESDPRKYDALDSNNDGRACPGLPPGFAPAFWTDRIPSNVEEAQIVRIIDGDTFEVTIDGVSNRVRIYRADTPETQNEKHCGGSEATAFAEWALSWNDHPGEVYIEKDKNEKDRYGRELAYVWFEVDGNFYLLNHVLINNGYAEDVDYGDRKYDQQLKDAAAFADRHDFGVGELCGGFNLPLAVPSSAQAPAKSNRSQPQAPAAQQPAARLPTVQEPAVAVPQPTEPAAAAPSEQEPGLDQPPLINLIEIGQEATEPQSGCDPNYDPCVPISPGGLNCEQIGYQMVTVIGTDIYGLDGHPANGLGCDSYNK